MNAAGCPSESDPARDAWATDGGGVADSPCLTSLPVVGRPVIITQDWDLLFNAVGFRLLDCFNEGLPPRLPESSLQDDQASDTFRRAQTSVSECVQALRQLHTLLTLERARDTTAAELRGNESAT